MAKNQAPKKPAAPKFVQVHYEELAGDTLAYAVAEVLNLAEDNYIFNDDGTVTNVGNFNPHHDWNEVGPLFDQFAPAFSIQRIQGRRSFYAVLATTPRVAGGHGHTHPVALCRAIVVAHLEPEDRGLIAVPESLLPSQVEWLALERNESQGQLALDHGPQHSAQDWKQPQAKPTQEADKGAQVAPKPAQEDKPQATPAKGQEKPQEAPKQASLDVGQDKPGAAPAQAKPAANPAPGKPLPQGKHAQALAAHAEGKGGKK